MQRIEIKIILLWLVLIMVSGWVRPMFYSNEEIHYASIAWEMWQHGHIILPIQGGLPYAEKGPLLFWLIQLGWWLFGVSSWWTRLLPELFGLGTLLILRRFVLQLWPQEKVTANLAPLILLGTFFFAAKIPVMRFDVMTTFFVLLSLSLLIDAIELRRSGWWLFAISVALGLLTKGPVLFLFILPAMLNARYWANPIDRWRTVYLKMSMALLFSVCLTAIWLIPAILQGGKSYAYALLFSRSLGRVWYGEYLQQNWGYYLFALAMMLLPWIIWTPFWRGIVSFYRDVKQQGLDRGLRFLFIVIGYAFVLLTCVSQKGPRYILPALPLLAVVVTFVLTKYGEIGKRRYQILIAAGYSVAGLIYALLPLIAPLKMQNKYPWLHTISPVWGCCILLLSLFWWLWRNQHLDKVVTGLTISTVLFWTCYNLGVTRAQAPYGDWRPLAKQVYALQQSGHPVAFAGDYQVLEFYGQLTQPLEIVAGFHQRQLWAAQHPDGWIVIRDYKISPMQLRLIPATEV